VKTDADFSALKVWLNRLNQHLSTRFIQKCNINTRIVAKYRYFLEHRCSENKFSLDKQVNKTLFVLKNSLCCKSLQFNSFHQPIFYLFFSSFVSFS